MKSYLALVFIILFPVSAAGQVIDQEYRKTEERLKNEVSTTCRGLSPFKYDVCSREVRDTYKRDGRLRGTQAFIRKNFGDASVSQLDQEIRERNALYGRLRGSFTRDRVPGELTDHFMEVEVSELRALINEKGGMPGGRRR